LPERLDQPLHNKKPTKYFVNSMSDLFHEDMPFDFLDRIFEVIINTPRHTYQILTKREQIMAAYFADRPVPANVWLGVTQDNKPHRLPAAHTVQNPPCFHGAAARRPGSAQFT